MPRPLPVALCLALAAPPALADEVMVFAAASLKDALDRVAADFEDQTGHQVTLSYAGSGQLARQVIAGAPADAFLSASPEWMDAVEDAGLLVAGTRRDLLGNRLVLIAHGAGEAVPVVIGAATDLPAMLGQGKLVMALVDAVPAGQYGKAALQHLGLWDAVAGQVAQADNVRAALALVATGEAPLGIVYATDAAAQPDVRIVGSFPVGSHPPITYPAALIAGADATAPRAFLEALAAPRADAIFAAQGFAVLP